MLREKRNRKRMGFWIDYGKDDELIVAEKIDTLKKQRKYQRAIFQGIQLIASLWEGRVDVLLTMFPWVADVICQGAPPKDDMDELKARLARMERMLEQRQSQHSDIPDTRGYGIPAMKPLASMKKMALPLPDDDDGDTIVLNRAATSDNSLNFMAGFAKLGQ